MVTAHRVNDSSEEAERSGFIGISKEQWTTLVKLLEDQKPTPAPRLNGKMDSLNWVLDTGATNYMTCSSEFLTDLKYILPCSIVLPNGKKMISKKKGTVSFDPDFSLKNVLLVPDL